MNIEYKVVSDSMIPAINIGDILIVAPLNFNIRRFDILLFKRNATLVVHYVWKNQTSFNNSIVTRSLKNIYWDEEPVEISQILGSVQNYKINSWIKFKILFLCFITGSL